MSVDVSLRGNNWAAQRKQAAEKVKDERKFNLAKAGEMSVGMGRVTSTDFKKPTMPDFPLDSKKPATMKYGLPNMDQGAEFSKPQLKASNGFRNTSNQYMDSTSSDNRLTNYSDAFGNETKGPRKTQQSGLKEETYQYLNNNLNRDIDQLDKALSKTKGSDSLGGYQPQLGASMKDSSKPPLIPSRNGQHNADNEDFSDFSNIPSRISKNTLNTTKGKGGFGTGEDFGPQFSKPKFGGLQKNSLDAQEKPTFESKAPQKMNDPMFQKTKSTEVKVAPKQIQTQNQFHKEPQSATMNLYNQERDSDYAKVFSKPNFKKTQTLPPAPSKQDDKNKVSQPQENEPLVPCPHGCGRNFTSKALEKHAKVCQKVFQAKGKNDNNATKKEQKQPAANNKAAAVNMMNTTSGKWKEQSEAFRARVKAQKNNPENRPVKGLDPNKVNYEEAEPQETEPLVQCPHGCGRNFTSKALEKHAKVCQKVFQSKKEAAEAKNNKGQSQKDQMNSTSGNWKLQSEAFRATVRENMKKGGFQSKK